MAYYFVILGSKYSMVKINFIEFNGTEYSVEPASASTDVPVQRSRVLILILLSGQAQDAQP